MAEKKKQASADKIAMTIDSLSSTLGVVSPDVEDGMVLRFDVPVTPRHEGGTDHLTYAALYVGDQWYLTGRGAVLCAQYEGTFDLLQAMTRAKAYNIELATKYRRVR